MISARRRPSQKIKMKSNSISALHGTADGSRTEFGGGGSGKAVAGFLERRLRRRLGCRRKGWAPET